MYTRCPNCNTHFEITQEYLDIANGKVRCGKCDHIFNALDSLYEEEPESESEPAPDETGDEIIEHQDQFDHQLDDLKSKQDTIDSGQNTIEKPDFDTTGFPSINIKEKMERIAASLSAATEELKSARETSVLKDTSIEQPTSQELPITSTAEPSATVESSIVEPPTSMETETTESTPTPDTEALAPVADISPIDDLSTTEERLSPESLSSTESLSPAESIDEPQESISVSPENVVESADSEGISESILSTSEESSIVNLADDDSQSALDELQIDQLSDNLETPEQKLASDETSALEIQPIEEQPISPESQSSEELATEDEFDILDYHEQELEEETTPVPDFSKPEVDTDDMDILNSLIEDQAPASSSDLALDEELDDLKKTLSDEDSSLDDELTNSDDDLDSGNDLLAELEQLESTFVQSQKPTPEADTSGADLGLDDEFSLDEEFAPVSDETAKGNDFDDSGYDEIILEDESTKATPEPIATKEIKKESKDEVVPSFLTQEDARTTSPAAMFGWLAGTIILMLALATQYLHINSTELAQNSTIRPLLETLCPITQCPLPLKKAARKIVTVKHDVRSHPKINNALSIALTFKNKAPFTQEYPILEIIFSNALGTVVARRKFLPDEYLAADVPYQQGLKNNQSQEINLKIVDPDPSALLSFQFNYL